MIKQIPTEQDMLDLAAALAKAMKAGTTIFLYGPLGAGKTTFVRGFLRALGYADKVKSPTYTLVESYEVGGLSVFHFDLYRLMDARELEYIGLGEYFTPESVCLVEWPEKGFPLLPEPDLSCYLSFKDSGREVRFEAHSDRGKRFIQTSRDPF